MRPGPSLPEPESSLKLSASGHRRSLADNRRDRHLADSMCDTLVIYGLQTAADGRRIAIAKAVFVGACVDLSWELR